ncbi:hypothetical protein FNV43_RR14581 [Rhamnella rubrinervis]|uniref:Malectin-like domain-containing protein n=1 Tax=Rhamnella rubrinervis TaxID=2594499 RepID=A0A8K0H3C7_9ROSA|nr:hypothetical protein FNV43_RR14581 [Rhamnella rubrinervis]
MSTTYPQNQMIVVISYLFIIFHNVSPVVSVSDDSSLPYIPQDNIALDCGSSGNSIFDRPIWEGDVNAKVFPSENQNTASIPIKATQPPTQVSSVPYQTARLSRLEFTYTFPVTSGQKFIRLHFYPALYENFDSSKAFFSVKAANYTLLSNFIASLAADALGRQAIVKEFCLNIVSNNKSKLIIAFTPVSSNPDSFAFINGVEVISMPTNLYYSEREEPGAKLVGQLESYRIENSTAMEMVYRINIGGGFISAPEDTGMFRTWEIENDYLTIPGYSVEPLNLTSILTFTNKNPAYTAPRKVYQTARSMGNKDRALIKSYYLTWEFPVDSSFYYLVRLHFCEIQREVNVTGDRVFLIHIANQLAEPGADVIMWAGGKYRPVHNDYVVAMFGKPGQKKLNLTIALQANPQDSKSTYADAILNGVEIFKVSDYAGNLAGPNPDPTRIGAPSSKLHRNDKNGGGKAIISLFSGVVSGVVIITLIALKKSQLRLHRRNY